MSAPTLRPTTPDDCPAWLMCGREVRGHCACDVATVPAARPDPVAAYATALRTAWRALEIVGQHAEGLTPAQVAEGQRRAREGIATG